MRRLSIVFASLIIGLLAVSSQAETKIAVVDIEMIVKAHPNTKADKALIKEQLGDYEAQGAKLEQRVMQRQEAYEKAVKESSNPALSEAAREEMSKKAQEARSVLASERRKARESVREMQKALTEAEMRMFRRTMKAVLNVVDAYAKAEGYDLVLDSSGQGTGSRGMISMPNVVFASDSVDITSVILKQTGGEVPEPEELESVEE